MIPAVQALLCVGRALPVNEGFEGPGSELPEKLALLSLASTKVPAFLAGLIPYLTGEKQVPIERLVCKLCM